MSYTELEHGYQGLRKAAAGPAAHFYVPDDCITGELELCGDEDGSEGSSTLLADNGGLIMGNVSDCSGMIDVENGTPTSSSAHMCSKQVVVGICAMAKKSQSKPMKEILTRLQEFEYIKMTVFPEEVILKKPVEEWPPCDCLISFHSKGFPLDKAISYAALHKPYVINNLHMQYDIQDRRRVYAILESEGIEIPRYAVLDRDSPDPKHHELVESEDHVEVNGIIFNKPFVEKPVSAEDHNIYIYYPTSAGGGSQRLFRKIGSRSSVYSPESRVRKTGSFIYEDFMPTDGTDVKVYTVGPDYAHAEARKSPALDGKVERDSEGKEIRYPVILSNAEKLISRKVCLAFKQAVCGFDLLRANGKSFVCDVNGFSFVKNSNKYYDDCAKILGNMILRELAPTLHIPWSVPFQLDDPPIVPTTFGKMMELRCVVAVIRHGDRTPKQKMKVEVRHPKFFEIFEKYDGYKHGHVKLKRPKQLQEILDIARSLLAEIAQREAQPEIEEKQGKLEQLKSVLEMYGHFSGINRKVQMKYQPRGRPRGSSSDDGKTPRSTTDNSKPAEPSLVLILKWGGELTPAGRIQAEELGRIFRCMYPGGQGEYAGTQGLGLLRLHSTFRHDLKIYASDEGRVQMTAAAFAKGLLALEGELTPILVQMVKSANTNGLLDNDCDSSKYQNMCKARLHELMQLEREFTEEERKMINPGGAESIAAALELVKNPARCCRHVHSLIHSLMDIVRTKREDPKTRDAILYHGETWELMGRRWGKIEKDFCNKNKKFDISKIPDIYDCIKYDLQHNQHTLQFEQAEELYMYAKYLADIVIPQEYGLTVQEKLTIGQGICTPLLKKIRADLQRNIEEFGEEEETVNRLNPRYSHGVSSPGRHVRTRLYFTSESHVHSLLTVLRYGGLLDVIKDEQWRRAMQYISMVSELNYMSQLVVMLYEDPTKDPCSEERFHVELHFSPGVNCCVQKNLPPGPGFRPHSRSESATTTNSGKNSTAESTATSTPRTEECSSRIDEETEPSADVTPTEELSRRSSQSVTQTDSCLAKSPIEEKIFRHRHKQSDPIPIGSCHTVCGHEAAHLAKRLTAELAQQQQAQQAGRSLSSYDNGRALSPECCEPRARSYDQQRQDTSPNAEANGAAGTTGALCEGAGGGIGSVGGGGASGGTTAMNIRRHRHSIAGQMSYFKMLGFGFGGPLGFKKLGVGSSTSSLFSTAVISGSSSAPNLRDMIPNTASASAIEGFGGVPPIRPLETLHNALSLRQLDEFLERVTSAPMPRTPTSSPPKNPSTPNLTPAPSSGQLDRCLMLTTSSDLLTSGINSRHVESSDVIAPVNKENISSLSTATAAVSLKLQSPCNSIGWSGPPSFVSSSGPSSPTGLSDFCSRESSDMSASLISSDGYVGTSGGGTKMTQIFPTAVDLDSDLSNVGLVMGSAEVLGECKGDLNSGEITPVSAESEFDFNTGDATAGSTADTDVTVTEDLFEESSVAPLPIDHDNMSSVDTDNLVAVEKKRAASFSCQSHDSTSYQFPNFYNNIFPGKSNINTSSATSLDMQDIKCNAYKRQNSTPITLDQTAESASTSKYGKETLNESKNLFTSDKKWTSYKEKFLVSKVTTPTESTPFGGKNTNEMFEKNVVLGNNLNETSHGQVNKCEKMELKSMKMMTTPGAIVVKEAFIEPPKINRVASLHEKHVDTISSSRRASSSDVVNDLSESPYVHSPKVKNQSSRRSNSEYEIKKLNVTPSTSRPVAGHSLFSENMKKASEHPVKSQRFTTTLVDETNLGVNQSSRFDSSENRADVFGSDLSMECSGTNQNLWEDEDLSSSLSTTPVLTLASSLTDQPSITHGFNIKRDEPSAK